VDEGDVKKVPWDLVWNRDYSWDPGVFSINSLAGRIKVPFETKGMEYFFDGICAFGTAKAVHKHGKFFLHIPIPIPMTKSIEEAQWEHIQEIVGEDKGVNFLLSVYDSQSKAWFVKKPPCALQATQTTFATQRQTPVERYGAHTCLCWKI
jgi:hypothetical protein